MLTHHTEHKQTEHKKETQDKTSHRLSTFSFKYLRRTGEAAAVAGHDRTNSWGQQQRGTWRLVSLHNSNNYNDIATTTNDDNNNNNRKTILIRLKTKLDLTA